MANSLMLMGAGKSGAAAAAEGGGGYNPPAVMSGLTLQMDAADSESYSGTGTAWTNVIDDTSATLYNSPVWTDEIASGVFQFDGSDDYASYPTVDMSNHDSGWTFAMWMNPQALVNAGTNGWFMSMNGTPYMMIKHVMADPGNSGMQMLGFGNSWALFSDGGSTGSDGKFAVDEWHHHVVRNNNDGTMDWFLNNYKDTDPPDGWRLNTNPGGSWTIGALTPGAYMLEFTLASILMYNRILSDSEIEDLYDGDKERFGLS